MALLLLESPIISPPVTPWLSYLSACLTLLLGWEGLVGGPY